MDRNAKKLSRVQENSGNALYPRERRMFRLLLQSNANYFGTLEHSPLPVQKPICCNTCYEEIACVTWDRKSRALVAIVTLHQAEGYAGGTRMTCAPEYLRFYLSFDDGENWQDLGHTVVEVENAPADDDRHYAASIKPLFPGQDLSAGNVRVRVVLAWDYLPPANQPQWKPVFGDVHETVLGEGHQDDAADASPDLSATRVAAGVCRSQGWQLMSTVKLSPEDVRIRRFGNLSFWTEEGENGSLKCCLGNLSLPEQGMEHAFCLPLNLRDYRCACAPNSTLLNVYAVLSREPLKEGKELYASDETLVVVKTRITIPPQVSSGPGEIALIGGLSARDMHMAELLLEETDCCEILVQGVPAPGHSYVVEISDDGLLWRPLTKDIMVTDSKGNRMRYQPDPRSGQFKYLPQERNVLNVLARWDNLRPGKWQVRLRVFFKGLLLPESDQVQVRLGEDVCGPVDVMLLDEQNPSAYFPSVRQSLIQNSIFPGSGLAGI